MVRSEVRFMQAQAGPQIFFGFRPAFFIDFEEGPVVKDNRLELRCRGCRSAGVFDASANERFAASKRPNRRYATPRLLQDRASAAGCGLCSEVPAGCVLQPAPLLRTFR